jgi:hypothetical protein
MTCITPSIETLSAQFREQRRQLDERHDNQRREAEANARSFNEYKTISNEWRGSLRDLQSLMLPRTEYDAKNQSLQQTIDILRISIESNTNRLTSIETTDRTKISNITLWLMAAGVVMSLILGVVEFARSSSPVAIAASTGASAR